MTSIYTKNRKIFFDTGAFIALAFKRDQYHELAQSILKSIGNNCFQVTTNLIVSETYTYLRYHVNHDTAMNTVKAIRKAEASGYLEVVYSDISFEVRAVEILEKYRDQDISYVDAVSFAVLEKKPELIDVFAFDGHFSYIAGKNIITRRSMQGT